MTFLWWTVSSTDLTNLLLFALVVMLFLVAKVLAQGIQSLDDTLKGIRKELQQQTIDGQLERME